MSLFPLTRSIYFIVFLFVCQFCLLSVSQARVVSCENIQKRLDQFDADQGGFISLTEEEYICDRPLVINKSNVTLSGRIYEDGRISTIRIKPGLIMPLLVIGDTEMEIKEVRDPATQHLIYTQGPFPKRTVRNITVQNLTLDGNLRVIPEKKEPGYHLEIAGKRIEKEKEMYNQECYNYKLNKKSRCENDTTSLRSNGITVRGAFNVDIRNVHVLGMASGGLTTEKNVERLKVSGFISEHNFFDGIAGYQTRNSVFENLEIINNRGAGLSFDIMFDNNIIQDATIRSLDTAIFQRWSRHVHYKNIAVEAKKGPSVFLALWKGKEGEPPPIWSCPSDNRFEKFIFFVSKKPHFVNIGPCHNNVLVQPEVRESWSTTTATSTGTDMDELNRKKYPLQLISPDSEVRVIY